MKVITLLNEKGGVGKTTLATTIGAGLAIMGHRVMVLDADPQGHCGELMGLPAFGGLYRLLVQEAEFNTVLKVPQTKVWADTKRKVKGSLYVLQSNVETRAIPLVIGDAALLRERLEEVEEHIDTVIIDTSPTPSLLQSMIFLATDYVIFPTECEGLSLDGLAKSTLRTTESNGTRKGFGLPPMKMIGVQPTMYDARTNAHNYVVKQVKDHFQKLAWDAIPVRTVWRDASLARRTIFSYAPQHIATAETWQLIKRVEEGIA
jgi:chromosome partitioning protein